VRPSRSVHPTVRAFAIILVIVVAVMVFQLYSALAVVAMLLEIAFALAIGYFLYVLWRQRRAEIGMWSARARWAFYGAILIVVVNLGLYLGARLLSLSTWRINGLTGVAWLLVFPLCGYAIWRIWRDEHSYR
jgi:hypothetical protein